jgi:hypothetical protein
MPRRRVLILSPAAALLAASPPPAGPPALRTGKERLSGKGADEQRLNDCKVPPAQRSRPRPDTCPESVGREPRGSGPPGTGE